MNLLETMAELVLTSLAEGIISELGSAAVKAFLDEFKLLRSVRDEIEGLKGTMSTIKAVLLDAEDKQATNEQVKVWLQRLNDVMYEADDLLDEFNTEALLQKVVFGTNLKARVRIFFSKNNQLVFGLKMGHKLKAVRQKLDVVAKDRMQFHLQEGESSQPETKKRTPSHSSNLQSFIGREKELKELKDLLLIQADDSAKKVTNIALVGTNSSLSTSFQ